MPRASIIPRGGSSTQKNKMKEEETEYDYEDGYYYSDGDGGEDDEYEYYEEDDTDDTNGKGYYDDDDAGEEGYIYLPDTDDIDGEKDAIGRSLRPIVSKATLSINSITSLPLAIPKIISKIGLGDVTSGLGNSVSSASRLLSSLPDNLRGLDLVQTGSLTALSLALVVAIITKHQLGHRLSSSNHTAKLKKKKKRKKNKKIAAKRKKGTIWTGLFTKTGKEDQKDGAKTYGDYSAGYPDDDDSVMDLDLIALDETATAPSRRTSAKKETRRWKMPAPRALISSDLAQNAWISIRALGGRRVASSIPKSIPTTAEAAKAVNRSEVDLANDNISDNISGTASKPLPGDTTSDTTTSSASSPNGAKDNSESTTFEKAERLQRQLQTMTESRDSLEQEYEASLRMLHEARIQLRRDRQLEQSQKQRIETAVQKLEAKYKAQMKERIERIRERTEAELRAEVEAELTETLAAKFRNETEAERTKAEERMREDAERRLVESESRIREEAREESQRIATEEAEEGKRLAVEKAVRTALEEERERSREELLRVREGIRIVLERERRAMREQVREATGKLREWVARERRGQLLQQAARLQEEAEEKFGGGTSASGASSASGALSLQSRPARRNATRRSQGRPRPSRPISRDDHRNDRNDDYGRV